ncbi:MAG TPA: cytochrome D1 domain-containing protein [Burkholderiaceae bacterium]|nr:cytochrome D1 domain-containing protein [Burkholderiaceae bacterium]
MTALLAAEAQAQPATADSAAPDVAKLYEQHCAVCHGSDRLGGMGPALLPESLARLRRPEATAVVAEGRPATQMPGFDTMLSKAQIAALVDWIHKPVVPAPRWSDEDIRASRIEHVDPATLSDKPVFSADPLNLFLVVETGDHHVSVLDGDRLEPIHRFPSRFALHGGPKFAQQGRYVFFGSRDGWVSKYDLWNLKVVAEIRAGINTRNVAVSPDGQHVAVANYLPHTLVLLDGDLNLVRSIPVTGEDGRSSRVSAVYDATPRQSFVAALKDVPEVWEIRYGDEAAKAGLTAEPRRTRLEQVLDDFFFTQDYAYVMGASREGTGQVVDLDARRKVADLALAGMPHLGSGITWQRGDRTLMASTNLKSAEVTVIDLADWSVVERIPIRGPGFFLRSHGSSPHAFVDSMMSPDAKHILQVIDKQTLKVVKEIVGEPGKTLAHIEFTRDGRRALASLSEYDGAIVVYDSLTLEEVKRLPMRKPIGKYNVWNKISREEGTSH